MRSVIAYLLLATTPIWAHCSNTSLGNGIVCVVSNDAGGGSAVSSQPVTITGVPSGGQIIVGCFIFNLITINLPTDDKGDTFSADFPQTATNFGGGFNQFKQFHADNVVGGTTVVTCNYSAVAFTHVFAFGMSGISPTSSLDQVAPASNDGGTPSTMPVSGTTGMTTQAVELLVSMVNSSSGGTQSFMTTLNPYTILEEYDMGGVSTTGAVAMMTVNITNIYASFFLLGSSAGWAASLTSFKAAASPGGAVAHHGSVF